MIAKKMEKALNDHLYEEFYSFYLYLAMSEDLNSEGLSGMAHWMRNQAQEEYIHAIKFMDYIAEQGGKVILKAIPAPPKSWKEPKVIFDEALGHEQHITACINKLVDIAASLKDHATVNFLNWFVGEQVEEEASAREVVDMFKMTGKAPGGVFMINRELAQRPIAANPLDPTPAQ